MFNSKCSLWSKYKSDVSFKLISVNTTVMVNFKRLHHVRLACCGIFFSYFVSSQRPFLPVSLPFVSSTFGWLSQSSQQFLPRFTKVLSIWLLLAGYRLKQLFTLQSNRVLKVLEISKFSKKEEFVSSHRRSIINIFEVTKPNKDDQSHKLTFTDCSNNLYVISLKLQIKVITFIY